MNIRNPGKRFA